MNLQFVFQIYIMYLPLNPENHLPSAILSDKTSSKTSIWRFDILESLTKALCNALRLFCILERMHYKNDKLNTMRELLYVCYDNITS